MKEKLGYGWPYEVTKKDLEISFFRGSGPGGQNRNKRDTACRIKHLPTGLVTTSQEHRTAEQNKQSAWKKLVDKLIPIMKKEAKIERYRSQSNQVRTYKEKQDLVIDERLEEPFSYREVIHSNGLDFIIERLKDIDIKELN